MFEAEEDGLVYIFNPEGIKPEDYKKKYPELATIPEFDDINSRDLIFVWWIANPTSYLYWAFQDISKRVEKAIEIVYGKDIPIEYKEQWLKGQFSPRLKQAIERMYKIRPDTRYRAKVMVDMIFDDYEKLLKKDITEFVDKGGQIDTNAYIKIRNDIMKQLPTIIEQQELGFGVKSNKDQKKQEGVGQRIIENYHRSKRGQ